MEHSSQANQIEEEHWTEAQIQDYIAYYDWQMARFAHQEWREEQRDKAPQILALLRQHIPTPEIREVEEFLSYEYGSNCLQRLLNSGDKI
jgi:hypothetical protein